MVIIAGLNARFETHPRADCSRTVAEFKNQVNGPLGRQKIDSASSTTRAKMVTEVKKSVFLSYQITSNDKNRHGFRPCISGMLIAVFLANCLWHPGLQRRTNHFTFSTW